MRSHWTRFTLVSLLLLPLAVLFSLGVRLRKLAYQRGWRPSFSVGVPVIVVGNITAGGSGKTPMVIWLVKWLSAQGFHPGVVSRGYGGTAKGCVEVSAESDPALVGDEPLLIKRKNQVPVVVGRDRVAAARALLRRYPDVNILVSDDGLQHYRLRRDMELAVLDSGWGLGNGLPLPAGPLREPPARLKTVDACICIQRGKPQSILPKPCYHAEFRFGKAYALNAPGRRVGVAEILAEPFLAVTGIGNPDGFFAMLDRLGGVYERKIFPDHHAFKPGDIPGDGRRVVMTEKDAVKCNVFARADWWAVEVEAQPDAAFIAFLRTKTRVFLQEALCQQDTQPQ